MKKIYTTNLGNYLLMLSLVFWSLSGTYGQTKKQGMGKIDPRLLNLKQHEQPIPSLPGEKAQNARKAPKDQQALQPPSGKSPGVLIVDGYVAIEAIAVDNVAALLSQLKQLGLIKEAAFGGMVSGLLPIDSVAKLAGLGELRFARPTYMKTNIGSVTSQGDQVLFSDVARSQFQVTGLGSKVGVLSDSYDALDGASDGVASGDLPGKNNPNGYYHPVEVLEDLPAGAGTDEGRAMIEIVHDVAPGAEVAFHTGAGGQANFAQGIIDLANAGANIIVDDIFYLAEPFFQDGIITQVTDIVSQAGISYFSAAGNSDRNSYESEFRATSDTIVLPVEIPVADSVQVFPSPYIFHDFDPGPGVDIFQEITFQEGFNLFRASVQWDEPFASVCEGCPGSQSDLDVFVALRKDTGTILYQASSFFSNINSDPVEIPVIAFNTDAPISLYLMIGKYVGEPDTPDPKHIKYVTFDNGEINQYATHSPTVVGHSNGAHTIAVGASFFFNNPFYFPQLSRPVVNSISTQGGTPILFDTKGKPIKPEIRKNPDVTGPDAGNTTFFVPGLDLPFPVPGTDEPDGFFNFPGTSAAAPHVAAVAALMNEAAGETLDSKRINEVMQATATDMDDPFTPGFDEGYDFKTGAGFVNAQKAIASVNPLPSVVSLTLINATTGEVLGALKDRIELSLIEGGKFNIRADVMSGTSKVGSVIFRLTGPVAQEQTENLSPYALFGDNTHGKYNGQTLPLGQYTLTATPFTNAKGGGEEGVALTVNFEVTRFPVASFSLVNAATDKVIEPLTDGATINLTTYPDISIAANPEFDSFNGSIAFFLNGKQVQVENQAPYAIAGDANGDFHPFAIEPGAYTLTAIPFSENNAQGDTGNVLTIHFSVVEKQEVTALVLFDASTGEDLDTLQDGSIILLDAVPDFGIRAEVNTPSVGSVEFNINGAVVSRDNTSPFTISNDGNTDLPPGVYVITATPYSKKGGLGVAGISLSAKVTLKIELAVTQLVLIDAENDTPIQALSPGDTLDLSGLPPISIEAMVNSEHVESVAFILNDERVAIENTAPYALGGNKGNDFYPVDLDTGAYVLTAIPYSADDLKGIMGTSLTVGFVVIGSGNVTATENMRLVAYPNPVQDKLVIAVDHSPEKIVHYTVLNGQGLRVGDAPVAPCRAMEIDLMPYAASLGTTGMFYIKVSFDTGASRIFRLVRE